MLSRFMILTRLVGIKGLDAALASRLDLRACRQQAGRASLDLATSASDRARISRETHGEFKAGEHSAYNDERQDELQYWELNQQ